MQRFKKILCVLEPGECARSVLERAVALAENHQAELTVADVIPRLPAGIAMPAGSLNPQDLQTAMVKEHEKRIASLTHPYRQRLDVGEKVLLGTSFLEVIREVLRHGHDLVIKCPATPTWLDRLFTGDDMHLLRKCPCPVWLVKRDASRPFKRIIAAVDADSFYPPAELATRYALNVQILEMAASLALLEFAELHVVYAWEAVSERLSAFLVSSAVSPERMAANIELERQQHQQQLERLLLSAGDRAARDAFDYLEPRAHLIKGAAQKEIPAVAKRLRADCIVMGTVSRTGVSGLFMGNTAETILEQIDCSLLAIKPKGFSTPIALE